jgi:hypothetical protein
VIIVFTNGENKLRRGFLRKIILQNALFVVVILLFGIQKKDIVLREGDAELGELTQVLGL